MRLTSLKIRILNPLLPLITLGIVVGFFGLFAAEANRELFGILFVLCFVVQQAILRIRCPQCDALIMKRKYDPSRSKWRNLMPTWRMFIPKKCEACGVNLNNRA